MRAVVGGTVTQVNDWSYKDRDGNDVPMLKVAFFSGRTVDEVSVPPTLGPRPETGDQVHYVADVKVRSFTRKDGSAGSALAAWADGLFAYDCDPFAAAEPLKAVKGA